MKFDQTEAVERPALNIHQQLRPYCLLSNSLLVVQLDTHRTHLLDDCLSVPGTFSHTTPTHQMLTLLKMVLYTLKGL
ncbi:hypothetical protein E2C01_002945 [Portunus trituberculatus]|uniref:Uncharacterized protein n=1 Tax=Portunus trituberculatus TaxID=210409 RepID=A0A5B7CN89_PORTR|nr:hypothetical protein [Portunus trituberculatus]